MDSPKSCKSTTTTAAETAPVQDSPVFSYISNLSPIQPVKAPSVTPGFPGLNSPPLVFTSPRLNPHSQTTFLKRAAQNSSGQSEGCKKSVPAVDASVSLDVQLNTTLNSCNEKGSHGHSSLDDQIGSPTGCSDQFLADVVNMDSDDPNVSSDSSVQEFEVIEQPPDAVTGSEENKENQEHEHNKMINEEVAVTPPAREIQGAHKEDLSINVSEVEDDRKLGNSISIDCQIIESELPVDDALKTQDEDCTTENAIAELAGSLDQSDQLLSGSLQIERKDESSVEATGSVSAEPVLKKERSDVEAIQHRGVRRRCLQFEDALQKVITNQQAQNPPDIRGLKSLRLETPLTPINMEPGDVIQPMHPRNINSTIRTPKPSGIGLHLNSIVNSVQTGSGAIVHVKSAQRGNFSIRGKNSRSSINSLHCDSSNSSSVLSLAENITASTEDNRHESNASLAAASSATSLSTFVVKPANSPLILNSLEDQSTPDNKRKYSNTEADGVSEDFKSSPKRKRKKYSNSSDGDGCKRCNCKKSRCLKLYCDCFAAGIYCAEPCSCQGCYNRPEFEETVLETRQQIESRNPLAFAPKVVQHLIDPPTSSYGDDGTRFTPSSARHKRGCNCKKSMCLKKYCECYQANVGCSDGCRCEGCKNIYGQKGEYGMIKDVLSEEGTNERTDGSLIEKMVASGTEMYHHELSNPHNLTPLTPAIQFSNHRKDVSKAWLHSGEYFLSPETDLPFIAPYMISPGSPRNSDNNRTISETAQEILDLVSSDQELYYGNPETVDDFSIGCHQPGNQQEWANISKPHSISGNKHYSAVSSSLRWRGSPNTPMVQFGGTKHLKAIELDDELSHVMQDDTPDILKENTTPLNVVKVSSPNKKRISPPHRQQHEFGSSSLDGLRTGRKFILKAVPSFPPLTPCLDSKSVGTQQKDDAQNCTDNK